MIRTAGVAAALLVCVAAVGVAEQVFRAGTDMVLLSVTAADAREHPIGGLTEPDFQVFEDGVRQQIAVFTSDPQPIALSILIDSSTSMETRLAVAKQAAIGFIQHLGPRDVAQVIAFADRTDILQPFTADKTALEQAIRRTQANGTTALYQAAYIAVTELNKVRTGPDGEARRQAIVLLSDGEDTSSLVRDDDVIETTKRSPVIVYAIGLRDKTDRSSSSRGFSQSDYVLRTLSQSTGGRVFFVSEASELPVIYGQIAEELANQYTIGYVSRNLARDGAWRQIAVRINKPGVAARTKSGYFGPTK